jgi:hypothetical protein
MTRTLKFSAIALLAVVVLWACGSNGPKEIGEKFLTAISKGDYETAKQFATEDAKSSLDMMASMEKSLPAGEKKESKIEIGEVKEEGDKATLSYKEDGTDKTLDLVKVNGEWKANWSKMGGATDSATDALEGAADAVETAVDSAAATVEEGHTEGH